MTILYRIFALVCRRGVAAGAFFKLRMRRPTLSQLTRAFFPRANPSVRVDRAASILVVGLGVSSYTFLRALKRLGYTNVTVVAEADSIGGKCVNSGCMVSEYFSVYRHLPVDDRKRGSRRVVESLRAAAMKNIEATGFRILSGTVSLIRGRTAELSDGRRIDFERLILGTGNTMDSPSSLGNTTALEKLWELPPSKIVIVTDGNIVSLSYADLAQSLGHRVTVCFTSKIPLGHLPSIQFFTSELRQNGICVLENTKVWRSGPSTLSVMHQGSSEDFAFDALFFCGLPELRLPLVDDKRLSIFDLDLGSSTVVSRPDIYLLGDAAGFLSAAEAELHARELARAWSVGGRVQAKDFEKLPVRLHAKRPVAMVGGPHTLLAKGWRSISFDLLGWSTVHDEPGRLWYLFDPASSKVEAIHICHREASELISIAASLLELPVSDPRWYTCSVHPSSAEIFKQVAEDVETHVSSNTFSFGGGSSVPLPPQQATIPKVSGLHRSSYFASLFRPEEKKLGVLDENPRLFFSLLLGLKLLNPGTNDRPLILKNDGPGRYEVTGVGSVDFATMDDSSLTVVTCDGRSIAIRAM